MVFYDHLARARLIGQCVTRCCHTHTLASTTTTTTTRSPYRCYRCHHRPLRNTQVSARVFLVPRMLTRAKPGRFGRERRRQQIRQRQRAGQRGGEETGRPRVSCTLDLPPTAPFIVSLQPHDVPRHRRARHHPRWLPRQHCPPIVVHLHHLGCHVSTVPPIVVHLHHLGCHVSTCPHLHQYLTTPTISKTQLVPF